MFKRLGIASVIALVVFGAGCSGAPQRSDMLPPSARQPATVGVAHASKIYISSVNDVGENEILVYSASAMSYSYLIRMPSDYLATSGEFAIATDPLNASDVDIYYANTINGTLDFCMAGPPALSSKTGTLAATCAIQGVINDSAILANAIIPKYVDVLWDGRLSSVQVLNPHGFVARFARAAFFHPAQNLPTVGAAPSYGWVKMAIESGTGGNISFADGAFEKFEELNGFTLAVQASSPLPSDASILAYDINGSGQRWFGDAAGNLVAIGANGFTLKIPNAFGDPLTIEGSLATDETYAYVYDTSSGTITYYKDGALLPSDAKAATLSVPAWNGPGAITVL